MKILGQVQIEDQQAELIDAPGGTINLNLKADAGGEYNPNQAIWIDSLASLNAQGPSKAALSAQKNGATFIAPQIHSDLKITSQS